MNAFKKPLSQEEERECLKRSLNGDLEARNRLVLHNMRLVAHVAKKYYFYEQDQKDLISVGTIGLIKAINTFKLESSNRLVTYASKCIENEILMLLRSHKKNGKDISIYESIGRDKEGNEINLLDIICDPQPALEEQIDLKQKQKKIYELIEQMEEGREKYIIVRRFGLYGCEELTQREIAKELGISRSYVSRIEKRTLYQLRKKFERYL